MEPALTTCRLIRKETFMSLNAKLALAAMLNGTFLGNIAMFLEHPEGIRDTLLAQVEDYFDMDPESSQFDKTALTDYLRSVWLPALVTTLDEMGRNPFSNIQRPMVCTGGTTVDLWEHFVSTESARVPSAG
jgi:hypothetical protein